ncbi:MAG: hypothetical protein Kow0098_19630 [Ignavibacteriaceae bacterium]
MTNATIIEGTSIDQMVSAIDTTGYNISYTWLLNCTTASFDTAFHYTSSTIFPAPGTDSLSAIDSNGFNSVSRTWFVHHTDVTSTGADNENLPGSYLLENNYPNRINPGTVIIYALKVAGFFNEKIYDILGREIVTPVNEY